MPIEKASEAYVEAIVQIHRAEEYFEELNTYQEATNGIIACNAAHKAVKEMQKDIEQLVSLNIELIRMCSKVDGKAKEEMIKILERREKELND